MGADTGHGAWGGRLAQWLPLVVFVIALAPRLYSPSPFITWDEPTWTYRSLKFARALQVGDLGATYLTAHPGVLTMWSGAAGILGRVVAEQDAAADLAWVDGLPEFDEDDTELLAATAPWWPWARAAIGFATALVVAAAYVLLAKLLDRRTAFVAALLLALDPFYLAHSRVLHLDALMSGLLLLSVLATLVGLRRDSLRYLALGGVLGGMAVLEKSPAFFVVPFTLLLVAVHVLATRDERPPLARFARALLGWALGAGAAYVLLWPAMWAAPAGTLAGMWGYAMASAGKSREAVFFWGRIQPDPGVALYVTALPFRVTPLVMVGIVAAVGALVRGDRRQRVVIATLIAFAVLFTLFMGTGAKKFERYILPVLPALDILAGIGLVWLAGAITKAVVGWRRHGSDADAEARYRSGHAPEAEARRLGRLADVMLLGLIAAQGAVVLAQGPYYLATYNPLLGGGAAASRRLPVGWGEGMDRVADYLNALPGAGESVVATPSVTLLAPLYDGRTVRAKDWRDAAYVVLYVDDVQIGRPDLVAEMHGPREPVHVVRIRGVDYAWVYESEQRGP